MPKIPRSLTGHGLTARTSRGFRKRYLICPGAAILKQNAVHCMSQSGVGRRCAAAGVCRDRRGFFFFFLSCRCPSSGIQPWKTEYLSFKAALSGFWAPAMTLSQLEIGDGGLRLRRGGISILPYVAMPSRGLRPSYTGRIATKQNRCTQQATAYSAEENPKMAQRRQGETQTADW